MASKKSDQDLIAQVVRELQAAGEEFTFDPAEALLAARTTAKQPRLGPGERMSAADTKRAVAFYGPKAVAALDAVTGTLHLRGDLRVYWIGRVEAADPEEVPITFDGHSWRDAPPAPERLGAILRTLTLDLDDEQVRESVLSACGVLVGTVIRSQAEAVALTRLTPQEAMAADPPTAAPADAIRRFEPPHVAGRRFVFCANLRFDVATRAPSLLRFALDMDTLGLDVQRLGRGRDPGDPFVMEGRAFVDDDGRARVAPHRVPPAAARGAVRAWQEAAAAEHASIASFARATLELMAVGAPLSLVARSQQAALDEVRHARLSLAVARRLAGGTTGVVIDDDDAIDDDAFAALPAPGLRAASLAQVATTTLLEAAVPETMAALCAGVAARRCRHDDVRAVLDELQADEARHADLAWDIVDWCVARDEEARAAVAALAATLAPPATIASCVDDDDDGQLCAASAQRCCAVAFHERVRPRLQRWIGRSA